MKTREVTVYGSSDSVVRGQASVQEWSAREAFSRGGRRSAKIVGIVGACALPFAFMEPFMFLVWGSVLLGALVVVVGPVLHLKFGSERISFSHVEAECPNCHVAGRLQPYLSTEFAKKFSVLCPACGQTASVEVPEL